ncbi:MAG: globin [Terriglobia bacterium]
MIDDQDIYALIGAVSFERLVAAFYRRVPADEVLGPMYPADDLAGAEDRLRGFLIFRFGGPRHYLDQRGHPRLRLRHAPFAIDQTARDHWMMLMTQALDEVQLPKEADEVLREFFQSTATFMMNR